MSERPRHLSLEEAIDRVLEHPRVVVGSDFDGTLAPLVPHPDDSVPDPRGVDLLRKLALSDQFEVAVVSGRSRADLIMRLGDIPGAVLVGEHGNDYGYSTGSNPIRDEAHRLLNGLCARYEGAFIEAKPVSVTFNYWRMADADAEASVRAIRAWAEDHEGVTLLEGKNVIELTTGGRSKGDAILEIAGLAPVVFFGDDVTDESVFEVLRPGDVGVKVGEGHTAAEFRVDDVAEVVTVLERIALAS